MEAETASRPASPLWGELRYGAELAALLADPVFHAPRRRRDAAPVLLIPGFMASDASLGVLATWLRRRGHPVSVSGMRANVGCSGRIVARLQERVRELSARRGPLALIGQSRGGGLARALAVREAEHVSTLVMLGSPVRDPLAVAPSVLRTVSWLARLGDMSVPGVLSTACRDGACCAAFREDLRAPLEGVDAVSIHSRSDAIVDWRSCVDPHSEQVEVGSSHCGMSVHPHVYRVLRRTLDRAPSRLR